MEKFVKDEPDDEADDKMGHEEHVVVHSYRRLRICLGYELFQEGVCLLACVTAVSATTQQTYIHIDKVTNGADGQNIPLGTLITWTYTVTNTGNVPLSSVTVTDNKGLIPVYQNGDTHNIGQLDPDETWIYTASGIAAAGSSLNPGTASATYGSTPVTASDDSSYVGIASSGSASSVPEFPSIALPAAFIVGLIGALLFIKGTKENE